MNSPENYRYDLVQGRLGRNLSQDFLWELKNEVDWKKILEALNIRLNYPVINRVVKWNYIDSQYVLKQGPNDPYICCPFHTEKSPSLHFDFRIWCFYCFGCHAKWDLFEFIMEYKWLSFIPSVDLVMRYSKTSLRKKFVTEYWEKLVITEIEWPTQEELDREVETYRLYCKNFVWEKII